MKITVVALGKIGLPVATYYASRGHVVTGCDRDARVVDVVNRGENPIPHEAGLTQMIAECVAAGRLRATTDTAAGVAAADVVVVLIPLGIDVAGRSDFRAMDEGFSAVARGIQPGTLVLLETTVPVGTSRERYRPVLEGARYTCGHDFSFAFSPERVQSGRVIRDLATYPRVVGGVDAASADAASAFYSATHDVPVITLASAEAAEFCKLAESVYRDVNIALANELAQIAAQDGVDYYEVLPAANSQPQSHLHRPGLGVGGHCIPVYPYFLANGSEQPTLARSARAINDDMHRVAADMLAASLGTLAGQRVLILGLTYRPGVRETAHSPALMLARALIQRGALVHGHDPLLEPDEIQELGLTPARPGRPGERFQAVVVHTADPAYLALDFTRFDGLRVVLDSAGAVDARTATDAGASYLAIGRPSRTPSPVEARS